MIAYNDLIAIRIDQLDKEEAIKMPWFTRHHLNNAISELGFLSKALNDPNNPKEYYKSIRQTLKSDNLFIFIDTRLQPAIHAMKKFEYAGVRAFEIAYQEIYQEAEELSWRAKELPSIKSQRKADRLIDDQYLYEASLELIFDLTTLCGEYVVNIAPYVVEISSIKPSKIFT